ncbi:transmembrane protein 40 isoform X5 [Manis pentadactyla]|uniref:transmembrane protein 40 isoform X5 n=1 Tax=Manis pentadactyla TaxID=143292 RepID=UPI00255C6F82|nr:transmembrane protein 40 isoform X5 [Manis pentadactyla]
METSGPSSQTQDHSQVPRETEDLDYRETDLHKQDGETRLFSQEQHERNNSSSSSSSSSSSPSTSVSGSGDEDQHPRATRRRGQSRGTGHPTRDSSPGDPGELVPSEESKLRRRGSDTTSGEVTTSELRRLNIKKDDEFFHFILLCFAIGALLVCYHYCTDWFMSLGVGLLTFASLETVGIYFGLVYRIHSVLQGFIPLFQKFRLIGFRKTD